MTFELHDGDTKAARIADSLNVYNDEVSDFGLSCEIDWKARSIGYLSKQLLLHLLERGTYRQRSCLIGLQFHPIPHHLVASQSLDQTI